MWRYRERLDYYGKLRRSLYEILRDSLERRLMKVSLIDSFYAIQNANKPYSFLDKSELKPKSKKMKKESTLFNTFIVIFCEGVISPELKNHIRFFPENTLIKKNLEYLADYRLHEDYHENIRHLEHPNFMDFLESLLKIDYALLIQQDPLVKKQDRYSLTHFHVKIDWPIADAAEDLAKRLRYIQNSLYEHGDEKGRILQNKLFEYYGCHHSVGGRRTAGLIAAQLLHSLDYISTVYVSTSESRSLFKYSERGISKYFLIRFTKKEIVSLAQQEGMKVRAFKSKYLYPAGRYDVGIAEVFYKHTVHSRPPEDGKLRKIKPAYNWLRIRNELLHPRIGVLDERPIPYNWVYSNR